MIKAIIEWCSRLLSLATNWQNSQLEAADMRAAALQKEMAALREVAREAQHRAEEYRRQNDELRTERVGLAEQIADLSVKIGKVRLDYESAMADIDRLSDRELVRSDVL